MNNLLNTISSWPIRDFAAEEKKGESSMPSSDIEEPTFLFMIQRNIDNCEWTEAFQNSLLLLTCIQAESNLGKIYEFIFVLLPHLKAQEIGSRLLDRLHKLLQYSAHMHDQQKMLALKLAKMHLQEENTLLSYCFAMNYYAKAIEIAAQQNDHIFIAMLHKMASNLFYKLIQRFFVDERCFFENLDNARRKGDSDKFAEWVALIDRLQEFCLVEADKEIIMTLYKQAREIITHIPEASLGKYREGAATLVRKLPIATQFALSSTCKTEKYRQLLSEFRSNYENYARETTRQFQQQIMQKFIDFFQLLLKDVFTILGPAPCAYDIRAMGSFAREEPLPFSDLEIMILIETDKVETKNYFTCVVQTLKLQIVSLGETPLSNLTFTCIYDTNRSGFCLDEGGDPSNDPDLIHTPEKMADRQKKVPFQTLQYNLLKSKSLKQSSPSLFENYQQAVRAILDKEGGKLRQQHVHAIFKMRFFDYQERWKDPFGKGTGIIDVKKQYVELLHFMLSDLALFFDLPQTNTLDIIEALIQKKVFAEVSGRVLLEAVKATYAIRLSLQLRYGQQNDKATVKATTKNLISLSASEQIDLDNCYRKALKPLYHVLKFVFDNSSMLNQVAVAQKIYQFNFVEIAEMVEEEEALKGNFQQVPSERAALYLKFLEYLAVQEPRPRVVSLEHCGLVDTKSLSCFLHKGLKQLKLRNCGRIKETDLLLVTQKCPRLEQFWLSSCQNLKKIQLEFPYLKFFLVEFCDHLIAIQVTAAKLKSLTLLGNTILGSVKAMATPRVNLWIENCPALRVSDYSIIEQLPDGAKNPEADIYAYREDSDDFSDHDDYEVHPKRT